MNGSDMCLGSFSQWVMSFIKVAVWNLEDGFEIETYSV